MGRPPRGRFDAQKHQKQVDARKKRAERPQQPAPRPGLLPPAKKGVKWAPNLTSAAQTGDAAMRPMSREENERWIDSYAQKNYGVTINPTSAHKSAIPQLEYRPAQEQEPRPQEEVTIEDVEEEEDRAVEGLPAVGEVLTEAEERGEQEPEELADEVLTAGLEVASADLRRMVVPNGGYMEPGQSH